MPNVYNGVPHDVQGARIGIVVSRYNESITGKLLQGALDTFLEAGIDDANLDVVWVPGAWEGPVALQKMVSHAARRLGSNSR